MCLCVLGVLLFIIVLVTSSLAQLPGIIALRCVALRSFMVVLAPQSGTICQKFGSNQVFYKGDIFEYDSNNKIIILIGYVEIDEGGCILLVDRVIYD